MTLLFTQEAIERSQSKRWLQPNLFWPDASQAVKGSLAEPTAVIFLDAFAHNAHDLLTRSVKPIRIASKSIRSREILRELLQYSVGEHSPFAGVLALSLAEAIWLAQSDPEVFTDLVVAYPTVDREGISQLSQSELLASRITLMVDSAEQLELIVSAQLGEERIRVCIDMDMSYHSKALGHIGVKRSGLYQPAEVRAFAEQILRRPDLQLVGIMGYEAQIAGLGDNPTGLGLMAGLETRVIARLQKASRQELADRRSEAVGLVRALTELEFVNGGGTGSIESTGADDSVTEIAAGSGFFGSHLFDHYRSFSPAPAAAFALPVTRNPDHEIVTLFGGGWVASGPAGESRVPVIAWPEGLSLLDREGAGEVQTPVMGKATADLTLGDAVWFRHAKAGELSEHANVFRLILGSEVVGEVSTYRGEGKVFV